MTPRRWGSRWSKRQRRRRGGLSLRMAPLIDVVFLLLVFFMLTANFRGREDILPMAVPAAGAPATASLIPPLTIRLSMAVDGTTQATIGGAEPVAVDPARAETWSDFDARVAAVLAAQGRVPADPVRLTPAANVSWDTVIKVYDRLGQLGLERLVLEAAP